MYIVEETKDDEKNRIREIVVNYDRLSVSADKETCDGCVIECLLDEN